MKTKHNKVRLTGEPDRNGNRATAMSGNDSRSDSVHGKSFSKKSFDQLMVEKR